ncbi:magnesium transporter [Fervidibacillus albus]|uniref:Magnesium transporter MgtE n=1 Tax=Fervidibacillus albus TaxID=2980026 RepID=A0A9E8RX80_9BACI|nr:magnesium transporter [Fervidibacillus albus]WAA09257.1 magnesium transporter [Fervidibacillus albus]
MDHLLSEDQLLLAVVKFIKENKKTELEHLLDELQPYDIAKIYANLPQKFKTRFLFHLNNNTLADVIQEMEDVDLQFEILNKLTVDKKGEVLNLMDNDDLASLLHDLPSEKADSLLKEMKHEESTIVQNIMQYPEETAGRLMTNRFVWIRHYYTVTEAVEKLKNFAEYAETINYLYVVDEARKLVGVVSYRDLLLAESHQKIKDVMYERVISVSALTDQEDAARTLERYDFLALPVVDENNVLLGIVTFDDMLDVIIKEAEEDIEKLSASGKAIDFDTKASVAARRRLPWLVLLLIIGIISGGIISYFEETLNVVVALAFFMPMITAMTGNTGTQSLALVVRGLAGQEPDRNAIVKLIVREFFVSLIIGIVLGIMITLIAYVWQGNMYLGLVVGLSLFGAIIIGTLSGTVIPLILYRFKIDPAIASGPLITTLNDIFSLLTYFAIATAFLNKLL